MIGGPSLILCQPTVGRCHLCIKICYTISILNEIAIYLPCYAIVSTLEYCGKDIPTMNMKKRLTMQSKIYSIYARSLVLPFCANLVTPLAPSCLTLCHIPHAAFFLPRSPSGPLLLSHVPYHFLLSLIPPPFPFPSCPSLCSLSRMYLFSI